MYYGAQLLGAGIVLVVLTGVSAKPPSKDSASLSVGVDSRGRATLRKEKAPSTVDKRPLAESIKDTSRSATLAVHQHETLSPSDASTRQRSFFRKEVAATDSYGPLLHPAGRHSEAKASSSLLEKSQEGRADENSDFDPEEMMPPAEDSGDAVGDFLAMSEAQDAYRMSGAGSVDGDSSTKAVSGSAPVPTSEHHLSHLGKDSSHQRHRGAMSSKSVSTEVDAEGATSKRVTSQRRPSALLEGGVAANSLVDAEEAEQDRRLSLYARDVRSPGTFRRGSYDMDLALNDAIEDIGEDHDHIYVWRDKSNAHRKIGGGLEPRSEGSLPSRRVEHSSRAFPPPPSGASFDEEAEAEEEVLGDKADDVDEADTSATSASLAEDHAKSEAMSTNVEEEDGNSSSSVSDDAYAGSDVRSSSKNVDSDSPDDYDFAPKQRAISRPQGGSHEATPASMLEKTRDYRNTEKQTRISPWKQRRKQSLRRGGAARQAFEGASPHLDDEGPGEKRKQKQRHHNDRPTEREQGMKDFVDGRETDDDSQDDAYQDAEEAHGDE
eukprot:TRINITY_DN77181_c0_g1_i1.p1 TRINITY_DN77181_c0_g1~~TRINITY_DN77181_c0_g1_i1.p1  ORF type:complete len:549 (-),score=117.10 TRINITY_DN77181_c0_g1_i1:278-1924(-)